MRIRTFRSPVLALSGLLVISCGGETSSQRTVDVAGTLEWVAPTTQADGTALTDLAGHKIYYRQASGSYVAPIDVPSGTRYSVSLRGVPAGTYYFAVTAYDANGNESVYSDEVSKSFQ